MILWILDNKQEIFDGKNIALFYYCIISTFDTMMRLISDSFLGVLFLGAIWAAPAAAFPLPRVVVLGRTTQSSSLDPSALALASGQGFGSNSNERPQKIVPEKTYGVASQRPIRDLIDAEAAMSDFFSSREEWTPLFQSMMQLLSGAEAPAAASAFLSSRTMEETMSSSSSSTSSGTVVDWEDASKPWKRLPAIPTDPDDRQVLSVFLDSMHQSLLDIPVSETKGEEYDDNDMHFLEEGRRMLAISRFHVLRGSSSTADSSTSSSAFSSSLMQYDDLFTTCWSELYNLCSGAQEHTGSLILLPDYFGTNEGEQSSSSSTTLADLRRFTDMNLLRPLEWMGLLQNFEIASIHHRRAVVPSGGSNNRPDGTATTVVAPPAIRLIYKLNDMPSDHVQPDG